jgi:hypothetical protein
MKRLIRAEIGGEVIPREVLKLPVKLHQKVLISPVAATHSLGRLRPYDLGIMQILLMRDKHPNEAAGRQPTD